eukprot:scaffold1230_cov166-Amphora_coffeaeformis.AAC.9
MTEKFSRPSPLSVPKNVGSAITMQLGIMFVETTEVDTPKSNSMIPRACYPFKGSGRSNRVGIKYGYLVWWTHPFCLSRKSVLSTSAGFGWDEPHRSFSSASDQPISSSGLPPDR